ncbi:hypothetical protein [Streptomyces sp. NPDC001621]|uniref:hypothetical protein n=1 Tax=Streptomyces sp. NPDC001621 TaxID=3364594 RepID=UPI0036763219
MSNVLTTDHPAWQAYEDGTHARAVRTASGIWIASHDRDGLHLTCVDGTEDVKPEFVATDPAHLPVVPEALLDGLTELGVTHRLANPWLWDGITTAILRQVVRADQARKVYRAWCSAYGTTVEGPHGPLSVAPAPDLVLDLPDEKFAAVGAKFHRTALLAAAEEYERNHHAWEVLHAAHLAIGLTRLPRVGPWTAAAAAADYTGDFSVYPHDDLAVRTWAARIAPNYAWPPKKDEAFGPLWTGWAKGDRTALHTLTLATLTWGAHAR